MRKFIPILAAPFVILAVGLALFASNVPYSDDYDAILNYLNYPWPERFFHLADFHCEHRIIVTRLVCEILYRITGHIDFRAVIWIGNVGWWIFAGFFAWVFWRRGGIFRWGAVFACWMLVGFYNHANAFWAMTAIQNHWVIGLAFVTCLAFSRRENWKWFSASLIFAVIATFTSGGGLFLFPAMALMAICDWIFKGRSECAQESRRIRIHRVLIFLLTASVASGLVLHNLPNNDYPCIRFPTTIAGRVVAAIEFFLCFCGNFFGNSPQFVIPSILVGVVIVAWCLAACLFVHHYRATSLAIFAFLAFLFANILAATVFRGAGAEHALAERYRNIPATIVVSLCFLTLVEAPIGVRAQKNFLTAMLVACLLYSSSYAIRGILVNASGRVDREAGIARWPDSVDGLAYPVWGGRDHAGDILRKSVELGVYSPPRCVKP